MVWVHGIYKNLLCHVVESRNQILDDFIKGAVGKPQVFGPNPGDASKKTNDDDKNFNFRTRSIPRELRWALNVKYFKANEARYQYKGTR